MNRQDDRFYALEEYKIGVALLMQANDIFWKRFEILFLINSGLLAAVKLTGGPDSMNMLIALAGVGICLVWVLIQGKLSVYQEYWNRGLDKPGKALGFKILSKCRYDKFGKGEYCGADKDSRSENVFRWLFRNIKAGPVTLAVPILLLALWIWVLRSSLRFDC